MLYSERSKLIASLIAVALFVGGVSLYTGVRLLNKYVLEEAANRVRLDLNAASEMYQTQIEQIRISLSITSLGSGFINSVSTRDIPDLIYRLQRLAHFIDLDYAGIVTETGQVLGRISTVKMVGNTATIDNPICLLALERRSSVDGTLVLTRDMLMEEDPQLAEKANIPRIIVPSGDADGSHETNGMVITAAVPIFKGNSIIGVLYGGKVLNNSTELVDLIRDTVFQGETHRGSSIGTATIFLNDIRIATNVMSKAGKRAVGTMVSKEVQAAVLEKGEYWTGRTYVVSDWYITAYRPIDDIFGKRVGMLYVGVLEEKYTDIFKQALTVFILITVVGMLLAVGFGFALGNLIMGPVNRLIKASRQVSEGNLEPDIGPIPKGEFGLLQKTFSEMVATVGRWQAASESKIIQSEKQASVGRLAAGVAHEINNPLTGVLTYSHMLLRRKDLDAEVRADLQTIVAATERVRKIVKGLLDFSRQTKLDPEPCDLNQLVSATVELLENQALVKGVAVNFLPGDHLPMVILDRSQIQSVLMNVIINALDATQPGGNIKIFTANSLSGNGTTQKGIEITIADTGSGIHPDHMHKLFDPFFTTKTVGQGTGLGLSVSQGIVHRHGGTIRVQSELGKGTRFFIWLPLEKVSKKP